MKSLKTDYNEISKDTPVYLIAEIGLNHNGDEKLAQRLIENAAISGAHAVKFQLFNSEYFIDRKLSFPESPAGSVHDFFKKFELSDSAWKNLKKISDELKLDFLCSIFDKKSLYQYIELGGRIVKIASGDLTNRPLLELLRKENLPVILSTGASTESEVERVVSWIGAPEVIMQCVSSYPAKPSDYDLTVLSSWQSKYNTLVGVSDHCMENDVSIAATALGAVCIEKHFTLDRNLHGADHSMSATPDVFVSLKKSVENVWSSVNHESGGLKRCMPSEEGIRHSARRSFYFTRDLAAGHRVGNEDLIALRPVNGIPAEQQHIVFGATLERNVKSGEPALPEDFAKDVTDSV